MQNTQTQAPKYVPNEDRIRHDQLEVVQGFVHDLREKHRIVPGPKAHGLCSDDYSDVEQLLFDDLVRTPDFTGAWMTLGEDAELLARTVACVHAKLRYVRNS